MTGFDQGKFYRGNLGVFVSQTEVGIVQGEATASRHHGGFQTFLWSVWIGMGWEQMCDDSVRCHGRKKKH